MKIIVTKKTSNIVEDIESYSKKTVLKKVLYMGAHEWKKELLYSKEVHAWPCMTLLMSIKCFCNAHNKTFFKNEKSIA